MSNLIEENMKETAAASTLLVQVIVLVLMGMFLSMHVLISFVWSGLLSVFLSVEWLPTAMHYLQSWEFARLSVGIPFVIMLFCFIHNYLTLKPLRLVDSIDATTLQTIAENEGWNGKIVELSDSHPICCDMRKMAKKARIKYPRLFVCCNSDIPNACTTTGRDGSHGVIVCSPLIDEMSRNDLNAIIGHELGHIIGNDVRRSVVLDALVRTLKCFYKKGWILCVKESGKAFDEHSELPAFVKFASALLVFLTGTTFILIGFLPQLWAESLIFWRSYQDEYHADARGAWLIGDGQGMADALIVLHWLIEIRVSSGILSRSQDGERDVHPPEKFRVRRWMPSFNGDWEAAYLDVMRRRGISR